MGPACPDGLDPERARALLKDPALARLLALLNREGAETRLVGGAVRNALIGERVKDHDLATTLLPEAVMARARAAGYRVIPTGIDHGTVTILTEEYPVEVTTLREDIETDGRHAVVRFGGDFRVDAARRDFTINALSIGFDGVIHDYFGGLDDLAARHVRFIGSPEARLREDYLRALRFLRFSARYAHGRLDPAGFRAILAHREGLAGLSAERVRQEVLALLEAPHALAALRASEREGLVGGVIGCTLDLDALERMLAVHPSVEAVLRLFVVAIHSVEDVTGLAKRLRLSNREASMLAGLHGARAMLLAGENPRLVAYRYPDFAMDAARALARQPDEALGVPPVFRIKGADLVERGVPHGPQIGRLHADVERRWIAAGLPEDEGTQRALLAQVMEEG